MNLFEMEKHHTKTLWLLALLLTFSTVVWAQGTPVTGRVSDEKGELLIGVSVQEKGTTNGTITDTNGQYNLKLTSNNPILIVSYIGYKSQEVKVGKQKVLDVILAEDVSSLDEVVVVAYGHQRKVSVVGAQSSMKIEDIKMPTANLSSAIAGRLPPLRPDRVYLQVYRPVGNEQDERFPLASDGRSGMENRNQEISETDRDRFQT